MGKPENEIESYLVERAEKLGAFVRKLQWVSRRGAPDRMIIYRGRVIFVECKAPGEDLDPHQDREMKRMMQHSAEVYTVDTCKKCDLIIDMLENGHW